MNPSVGGKSDRFTFFLIKAEPFERIAPIASVNNVHLKQTSTIHAFPRFSKAT
jgi:hypothetical protein